ncbi:MAG: AraC family transcriptional regulator [Ruminococcaceae bacterium]|nr:AraC family transcriptional regulator [Oscillospiraceae bacterium]
MIRNLNQVNFAGFGTISPERAPTSDSLTVADKRRPLHLVQSDSTVYKSVSDVRLHCGSGMTVLSVSLDGEDFLDFYLDKPVCITSGVYFCLSPLGQENSQAEISSDTPPVDTGRVRKVQELQLTHRIRVTNLYTLFYHEKERGFFFPGESHPMSELTYVDQGSLHSVADGQDLLLEQGDLVIYGPDQWHMQYSDVDVAPRYVTISFDLEGCDISSLLNRKIRIPQKAALLLQQLLREQERMDNYSTDMMISLLNQLFLTVLRYMDAPVEKLKTSNAVHSENEIIRRAQQYISTHIREKLSVPLVARQVDVSPSYLTALFHKNLQISPGEYIRRIKLQESKQMIREDTMNFTEIAATLHYSTVHHFSRQFKEKFGITPTEYARSVR